MPSCRKGSLDERRGTRLDDLSQLRLQILETSLCRQIPFVRAFAPADRHACVSARKPIADAIETAMQNTRSTSAAMPRPT